MAVLPTIPSFTVGDTSVTKLQQLSDAIGFLSDIDFRPMFKVYKTATASITLNTWTTLPGGTQDYDNDGFFSSGVSFAPTIQTQGYYAFEACVPLLTGTSTIGERIAFLMTAGANNPNLAPGGTFRFGLRGGNSVSTTANDTAQCTSDLSPMGLYPGDTVALQVFVDATTSTNFNANASYISGRVVPMFMGYWTRTAP
jgi:hypothetical protein